MLRKIKTLACELKNYIDNCTTYTIQDLIGQTYAIATLGLFIAKCTGWLQLSWSWVLVPIWGPFLVMGIWFIWEWREL